MAGMRLNSYDGADIVSASINIAATGALVAAVAGQRIRVYKLFLANTTGTTTLQFADGANNLTGVITLATATPLVLPFDGNPWFLTSLGNAFNLTLGASTQVSGILWFTQNAFNPQGTL
jgi:hypothetical protein